MMARTKYMFKHFRVSMICFIITKIHYVIKEFETIKCYISLKRFLMVRDFKFIFFLLLNANQIPLIRDLQVLSQYMKIVGGGLEELYLG